MPTQTDLVNAAYAEITVSGSPPSTEDSAAITARVAPVIADLAARRVATITATAITDTQFPDLVTVLAERAAPLFGRATNLKLIAVAETRLREAARLDRTQSTPLVRQVLEQLQVFGAGNSPFDAAAVAARIPDILAELAARNVTYIPDEASVPSEINPHLVRYIAASLASPPLYPIMDLAKREMRFINRQTAAPTEPVQVEYF